MANLAPAPAWVRARLKAGLVIPAHPLALTAARRLDEPRQRALTRYYHASGAGGLAVGVHTTQFAIRNPKHGLFKPVLQLAAETLTACESSASPQSPRAVRVAGICGLTPQAVAEARLARELGYHAGLLSLGAWPAAEDEALLEHARAIAEILPLFGFYLQPAAGGRPLSFSFWHRFAEIDNVLAIKMAPFNRYQTLDVVRAVAESGRTDLALYTGNDDNIVGDLVTPFVFPTAKGEKRLQVAGGLLGHWACWTRSAVELLEECRRCREASTVPASLLARGGQITDCNAAFFDVAHGFAGCVPGIHEILRRQGLLAGIWCLDPQEQLSPGQAEEIDRVCGAYPHLSDDAFVREHLDEWLR